MRGVYLVFVSLSAIENVALQPHSKRTNHEIARRQVLQQAIVASTLLHPSVAFAGEVGARITKAVTQSDIGISARRSVVKGAQVMDGMDGQWERFSDKFGLGAARQKQPGRPDPKVIPDPQPLDINTARQLLQFSDSAFCQLTQTSENDLKLQVRKVQGTVGPSFLRSGLSREDVAAGDDLTEDTKAARFNFLCYTHYKAYSDIIIDNKVDFLPFRNQFEAIMGEKVASLLSTKASPSNSFHFATIDNNDNNDKKLIQQLKVARNQLDQLGTALVNTGLVALVESTPLDDKELVLDWSNDLADLQWSIALDGDITLGCQLLLQEQGYRLYPNYGRYAAKQILETAIPGISIQIDDYYMDTNYNSDPDRFEVKEVLLNVVVEGS